MRGVVPAMRVAAGNAAKVQAGGEFVLYWMIALRRARWNFALDRAIEWARELQRPLLILEALRCDYPWASDRLHRFVLDGMAEKVRALRGSAVSYYPYVEPAAGAGRGLLERLAKRACVVVTDDFPCFFLPRMVQSAATRLAVRLEVVDSNGLLPLRATSEVFSTAHAFRRFLQKNLPKHLEEPPSAAPLLRLRLPRLRALPGEIIARWQPMSAAKLADPATLGALPIDHTVKASAIRGGEAEARKTLQSFLAKKLGNYPDDRNEPDQDGASGLSPYVHFGHISSHEIFARLMRREKWSEKKLALRATGSRVGWWGASAAAEAFLDQFITWREVGFNFASKRGDYDRYDSLPAWAQRTLAKHARDERERIYTLEQFADARIYDPLWNAAQRQLMSEGRMHNYMRMLWGKKILEWTRTPQEALAVMIELNNRYALDGRDPNSYSGIFWCLGRYDRAWGPERPIFGTVRYMSSANTARKWNVKAYLRKYGGAEHTREITGETT